MPCSDKSNSKNLSLIGRRTGTIYCWIEEMYGVRIGSVEQVLRVAPMPKSIAAALRVDAGAMAVAIRRAYRLTDGELVEVAFNLHPGERFTSSLTMQRRS